MKLEFRPNFVLRMASVVNLTEQFCSQLEAGLCHSERAQSMQSHHKKQTKFQRLCHRRTGREPQFNAQFDATMQNETLGSAIQLSCCDLDT